MPGVEIVAGDYTYGGGTIIIEGGVTVPVNIASPELAPDGEEWTVTLGDGERHPLSGFFGSLGAAQAIYPTAQGLTDTLAQVVFEKAIAADPHPDESRPGRGHEVHAPIGVYIFNRKLRIPRSIQIRGEGGSGRYAGTKLLFDDGTVGIEIVDPEAPSTEAGNNSVLANVAIEADDDTDPTAHGIDMNVRAHLHSIYVNGFGGNGIEIVATSSADPSENANCWLIDGQSFVERCKGHGLHVDGVDANAGNATGLSAVDNEGWGIFDESFLGNNYFGCHTNGNGTRVYNDANVQPGDTEIIIDNPVGYTQSFNKFPASGTLIIGTGNDAEEITYSSRTSDRFILSGPVTRKHFPNTIIRFVGGAGGIKIDGSANRSVVVGQYTEADQGAENYIGPAATAVGGNSAWEGPGTVIAGGSKGAGLGYAAFAELDNGEGETGRVTIGSSTEQIAALTLETDTGGRFDWLYRPDAGWLTFRHDDDDDTAARWSFEVAALDAQEAPVGSIRFPQGIMLGSGTSLRLHRIGTDAGNANPNTWLPSRAGVTVEQVTAGDPGDADEAQIIRAYGVSGNFTVTYDGQTTTALAVTASAATVQAALEALSNIAVGDVVVTSPHVGTYLVTFAATLAETDLPLMTATNVSLLSYRVGDTVNNRTPAASGYIGWVCITAGTETTSVWKQYGAITA